MRWFATLSALFLLAACAGGEVPVAGAPPAAAAGDTRCASLAADSTDARDRRLGAAVDQALVWIRGNTVYREIDAPCVAWATRDAVAARLASVPRPDDPNLAPVATYSCSEKAIHLREEVARTLGGTYGVSVVLHELIHHGQCLAGLWRRLPGCELERQAYQIQAYYVREQTLTATTPEERARLHAHADRFLATATQVCNTRRG